jgi:hypothetical protein
MASAAQLAKRAFVRVLLATALLYSLDLSINRDSADKKINASYQRLFAKLDGAEARGVEEAKVAWEMPRKKSVDVRAEGQTHRT